MKGLAIVLILLFLVGCATTVTQTYTPDGRVAYELNCSGRARGWDKCMKTAGDLCGARGYQILDRTDESMVSFGGDSSGFYGSKTNARTMLISCGQGNKN